MTAHVFFLFREPLAIISRCEMPGAAQYCLVPNYRFINAVLADYRFINAVLAEL